MIVCYEGFEEAWNQAEKAMNEDDVRAIRIKDRICSVSVEKLGKVIRLETETVKVIVDSMDDILLSVEEGSEGTDYAAIGCYTDGDVAEVTIGLYAPSYLYVEHEEYLEVLWKQSEHLYKNLEAC